MDRPQLPLNALRAFETAARHLSFTRAAIELCVSQTAVSHQIKGLEARLGVDLFRRLPRGLALTEEGEALVPVLGESFDRIGAVLDRFADGRYREVLNLGVVGTFALGWLLPRQAGFKARHPGIDLRISTNNNRVDLAGEGLDGAIRFGDGDWPSLDADPLFDAPLTPMCPPSMTTGLLGPEDLGRAVLLRSYRQGEWPAWFQAAGVARPRLHGPVFDSAALMAAAAAAGVGVALLPARLFEGELASGRLCRPFATEVTMGRYWLTRLRSRPDTPALGAFRKWLRAEAAA